MAKKLMILGASELQLPAIRKAKEMGLTTVVADYDPNAVGAPEADVFCCVSTLDHEGVLAVAKRERIDGIMTICSDRPMRVVAKVSRELGLSAISEESALLATNKAHMRLALQENEVPIPQFAVCRSREEYLTAVERMGLPLIVKPSDNSGSRGIVYVREADEVMPAYDYSRANSMENVVLVEEFMDGDEVSAEVFAMAGDIQVVQITDKITTGAPHFVEMGHTQPSALSQSTQEEIRRVAVAAVKALGITDGPAHVELKATATGVKIVELGARLGGDFIATDLVLMSTGVDMVRQAIEFALGNKAEICPTLHRFAAIRYVGKLRAASFEKGDAVFPEKFMWTRLEASQVESSRDRECAFLVSDDSREGLLRKIEQIRGKLEIADKKLYW